MKFIKEETVKANTHVVTMFDRPKGWFNVRETMDHNKGRSRDYYQVELDKGWCDCGKFQTFSMPYTHVIVVYSYALQGPSNQLSVIYKVINIFNVYNNCFLVVEKEDYWSIYQEDIV